MDAAGVAIIVDQYIDQCFGTLNDSSKVEIARVLEKVATRALSNPFGKEKFQHLVEFSLQESSFPELNAIDHLETGDLYYQLFGNPKAIGRIIAGPLFCIDNTARTNDVDLKRLGSRIDLLFRWRHDKDLQKTYFAPCLALVQSSGTGKTKLLFDYRQMFVHEPETKRQKVETGTTITGDRQSQQIRKVFCISCLSEQEVANDRTKVKYDLCLELKHNESPDSVEGRKSFLTQLERLTKELPESTTEVVLLFDESQNIVPSADRKDRFLLRCLLWALKAKSSGLTAKNRNVVAVLTGTSQALTAVYSDEESYIGGNFSREPNAMTLPEGNPYLGTGKFSFIPFIEVYSTGSMVGRIDYPPGATEYDISIQYGRPLFARLIAPGLLRTNTSSTLFDSALTENQHAAILHRMLVDSGGDLWHNNEKSVLSILATRAQLGSTHTAVVSDLVAKGYANLVYVCSGDKNAPSSARFCYMPDPVCARLAMCMMIPGYSVEGAIATKGSATEKDMSSTCNFRAIPYKACSSMLSQMFSSGLCHAPRGDIGEVASVLYMLMCGDKLRYKIDSSLKTFSIRVSDWLATMEPSVAENQGPMIAVPDAMDVAISDWLATMEPSVAENQAPMIAVPDAMDVAITEKQSPPWISAIQACRNDLRCPIGSMLKNDRLLEQLYKSGVMLYAHEMCEAVDCFTACRIDNGDSTGCKYVPLAVSIKTRATFHPSEQKNALESVIKLMPRSGICILFLCDVDPTCATFKPIKPERVISPSNSSDLIYNQMNASLDTAGMNIVARIVRMPSDDPYGLSNVVHNATRLGSQESELVGSHAFWGALAGDRSEWARKKSTAKDSLAAQVGQDQSPPPGVKDIIEAVQQSWTVS